MNRVINEYHVIEAKSHPLTKMEDIIEDVHVSIQAFHAFPKHLSVFTDRKKTQMSASTFCTFSFLYEGSYLLIWYYPHLSWVFPFQSTNSTKLLIEIPISFFSDNAIKMSIHINHYISVVV